MRSIIAAASLKWCCSSHAAHAAPRCLRCLADRGGCWVHGGRQHDVVWVITQAQPRRASTCCCVWGGADPGGVVRVGLITFRCLFCPFVDLGLPLPNR